MYSPVLNARLEARELRILANKDCGGVSQIVDWGKAWCHSGFTSQICFIVDADKAGGKAKCDLERDKTFAEKESKHKVKVIQLVKPQFAIELAKKKVIVPITIESLIDGGFWRDARVNGWLEPCTTDEIKQMIYPALPTDMTLIAFQQELLDELQIAPELFTHRVRSQSKQIFCTEAINKSAGNPDLFSNFQPLIKKVESFFL